jgi:hypothetical protein
MSQKTLRGSHQEGQTAGQPETSFASLPEPVVAHIAHLSKQRPGPPLMGVSSSCRDAVLSSLTSVRLHPLPASEAPFSPGPHARLLHRACCQARPGLQVELILWRHCGSLPQLLQPGIEYGGWRNVHKLKVCDQQGATHCGHLCEPTEGMSLLLLLAARCAGLVGSRLGTPLDSSLPSLDRNGPVQC